MKLLIAGSRDLRPSIELIDELVGDLQITELVHGGAKGVDCAGGNWAKYSGVPTKVFEPNWNDLSHPDARIKVNKYGKEYDANAGHRRNAAMADYADYAIIIWDGASPGSKNMMKQMELRGKEYKLHILKKELSNA